MDYVITLLTGLLIGIIPSSTFTKNIIIKMKFKGDFSNKTISFIFDLTKGVVIVIISKYFFNFDFIGIMISLIIGVLSHGFIQGFKFITVEGQFLALSGLSIFLPIVVLVWMTIWLISFAYKRMANFSLVASTMLTGLVSVTSPNILNNEYIFSNPAANSGLEFSIFVGLLFTFVLLTQFDKFKSYIYKKN